MASIHGIITLLTSPLTVGLFILLGGIVALAFKSRRWGFLGVGASLLWLWLWSTPAMCRWLGLSLERRYPPQLAEEMPKADAIAILGGGMGANANVSPYAEMWMAADRVWHGARLWRAQARKAEKTGGEGRPVILATGGCVRETTAGLLADFGVPTNAVVFAEGPRNTEEEARFVAGAMNAGVENRCGCRLKPRVLLVTSAWHMRRAMLMFRRLAPEVEVVPAATDYETLVRFGEGGPTGLATLVPDANCLMLATALFKEHFAYWCYRLKFRVKET